MIKVEVRFLIPVLARRVEKLRFFGGVAITYEEDVTVLFSQQTNFKKPFCARRQEEEKEEKKTRPRKQHVHFNRLIPIHPTVEVDFYREIGFKDESDIFSVYLPLRHINIAV